MAITKKAEKQLQKEMQEFRDNCKNVEEQPAEEEFNPEEMSSLEVAKHNLKRLMSGGYRNIGESKEEETEEEEIDIFNTDNDVLLEEPLPTTLAIDLIPIEKIVKGTIYTEDNRLVKVMEVLPINFMLKGDSDQELIINEFLKLLTVVEGTVQIKSIAKPTDIGQFVNQLDEDIRTETSPKCLKLLKDEKKLILMMSRVRSISRRYFIVLEQKIPAGMGVEGVEMALNDMQARVIERLHGCGNAVVPMNNPTNDTAMMLFDMLNQNLVSSLDFPERVGDVYSYYETTYGKNAAKMIPVKEMFTPKVVNMMHPDYIKLDDTYYSFHYVKADGYPPEVWKGWISLLMTAGAGVNVDFFMEKNNKSKARDRIGRHLGLDAYRVGSSNRLSRENEQASDQYNAGIYLKEGLRQTINDFWYMGTMVTFTASSLPDLREREKRFQNEFKGNTILLADTTYAQLEAFQTYMPLAKMHKKLWGRAKRNMLTTDLAAAYPFTSYEIFDPNGIFLGMNEQNGSLVVSDIFDTSRYSNANVALMGSSGAGKSFTLQLIATRFRRKKIQVYIIAPEKGHEFKRMCEYLGGEFLSLTTGGTTKINPLDVRKRDAEASIEIDGVGMETSDLAEQIKTLHVFFKLLIPTITADEDVVLDEALAKTYLEKGITTDNESLLDENDPTKYKQMPILADLYHILEQMANDDNDQEALRLSRKMARYATENGTVSLFNGQTTSDMNNLYIVFDISRLEGNVLSAAMYLSTNLVYEKAKEDRTKKKCIIVDETWKLIGGEGTTTEAAEFVLDIFKLIRGYGGAAICATQDLSDFFRLEDGKYGKGILNNCETKLFMKTKKQEAEAIHDFVGLSESETKRIQALERGHALLSTNGNNTEIMFQASRLETALITTDREQLKELMENGGIHQIEVEEGLSV